MTDDDQTPAPAASPSPSSSRESLLLPIVIPLGLLAGIGLVLWGFSRVLLRVEPKVATVTALLVAASIVTIVAIAASQKRVTSGSLLTVVGGVFGVAMLLSGAALLVGTERRRGRRRAGQRGVGGARGRCRHRLRPEDADGPGGHAVHDRVQQPGSRRAARRRRRLGGPGQGPGGRDLPRRGGDHGAERLRLRGACPTRGRVPLLLQDPPDHDVRRSDGRRGCGAGHRCERERDHRGEPLLRPRHAVVPRRHRLDPDVPEQRRGDAAQRRDLHGRVGVRGAVHGRPRDRRRHRDV